jgi:hypothetical protein
VLDAVAAYRTAMADFAASDNLLEFADAYSQQNLRDYRALADAAAEGRITRETDPNVLGM